MAAGGGDAVAGQEVTLSVRKEGGYFGDEAVLACRPDRRMPPSALALVRRMTPAQRADAVRAGKMPRWMSEAGAASAYDDAQTPVSTTATHLVTAKATTFCELYVISVQDLSLLLSLYAEEDLAMQLAAGERRSAAVAGVWNDDDALLARIVADKAALLEAWAAGQLAPGFVPPPRSGGRASNAGASEPSSRSGGRDGGGSAGGGSSGGLKRADSSHTRSTAGSGMPAAPGAAAAPHHGSHITDSSTRTGGGDSAAAGIAAGAAGRRTFALRSASPNERDAPSPVVDVGTNPLGAGLPTAAAPAGAAVGGSGSGRALEPVTEGATGAASSGEQSSSDRDRAAAMLPGAAQEAAPQCRAAAADLPGGGMQGSHRRSTHGSSRDLLASAAPGSLRRLQVGATAPAGAAASDVHGTQLGRRGSGKNVAEVEAARSAAFTGAADTAVTAAGRSGAGNGDAATASDDSLAAAAVPAGLAEYYARQQAQDMQSVADDSAAAAQRAVKDAVGEASAAHHRQRAASQRALTTDRPPPDISTGAASIAIGGGPIRVVRNMQPVDAASPFATPMAAGAYSEMPLDQMISQLSTAGALGGRSGGGIGGGGIGGGGAAPQSE
jgi:uncharacterized membrane protein YgcG